MLLSFAFAACSLNPQPIPPGARAGDAGFASGPETPNQDKRAEDASPSPITADAGAVPTGIFEAGLDDVDAAAPDGDSDGGNDAAFDAPDGATQD
jgi:hypothetical protein